MSNDPIHQEEYPFFTAAPAKKSPTGWKIAAALLASCLAVSVYFNVTGLPFGSPAPESGTSDQHTALELQVQELTETNRTLEARINELTGENTELTNRVVSLLNECNELNRELEQGKNGGLTETEVLKMQKDLENYNLILDSYIAMLRRDSNTLSANVEVLMAQANDLPGEARNALYILLEYMDRF
ncbi:MAG: hypothetical protein IJ960_08935 [Oscillospiraceae bacterium]|nr:hypothetical protein [Oscillospiraceae bacterium]